MVYIQDEDRSPGSLFPIVLDDLVPVDHMCHVIDAFVTRLALSEPQILLTSAPTRRTCLRV